MKNLFLTMLISVASFASLETSELKRKQAYIYEQQNQKTKAFELYQEAVSEDDGNPKALHDLALCYKDGYGTKTDKDKYFVLMQKAANLGAPKPMLRMAEIYGAENFKMALYWMATCAEWQYAKSAEDKRIVQGAQKDLYRNLKRLKKFSFEEKKFSLKYQGLFIDTIDLNHQAETALPRTRILLTTPTSVAVLPENDDPRTPMTGILGFLKEKYSLEMLKTLIAGTEDGLLDSQLKLYNLLQDHISSPDQFQELGEIEILLNKEFQVKRIKLHHFSKRASKEKAFAQ